MGNILGGMEVVGLLGMMAYYFGESMPSWGFGISFCFVIIPIVWIIIIMLGGRK